MFVSRRFLTQATYSAFASDAPDFPLAPVYLFKVIPFDKYPLDGYLKKAEKLRNNYIMAYKEIDKQDSDFDFKILLKNELKELPKAYTSQQVKQMELGIKGVHRIKRLEKYDLGRLNVEFLGGNKFEKVEA